MKRTILISFVIAGLLVGVAGLYVFQRQSDWDSFDPNLLAKSVTIKQVLKSPKQYLNQSIILRTNWIPGVEGPWMADDPKHPLEDNSHISFRWADPKVFGIYSEKGISLNTYPVFISRGPILAEGIFSIGDFEYYWGIAQNIPQIEVKRVYIDTEKLRSRSEE